MANPYPSLNINPFTVPLQVQIARDANGTPSWRTVRRHRVPGYGTLRRQEFHVHRSLHQDPYVQQWTFNVQFEPVRGNLIDVRYVGTRGIGLMAKVKPGTTAGSSRDAGQRLHRYPHPHRRADQSGLLRALRIPGARDGRAAIAFGPTGGCPPITACRPTTGASSSAIS